MQKLNIIISILLIFISSAQAYRYSKESCAMDTARLIVNQIMTLLKSNEADPKKVYLRYYNKRYPNGTRLTKSNLDLIKIDRQTKILISGWSEGHDVNWITDMTDIYIKATKHNIIIFDYDEYAYRAYLYAVPISKSVGQVLGDLIMFLVKNIKLNLTRVHIIGHSMGSHVAGHAGKHIFKVMKRKIHRITSLDAAGPIFVFKQKTDRLIPSDADFVDAIHTNDHVLGFAPRYGTIDIYVGNRVLQTECVSPLKYFKANGFSCASIRNFLSCSHRTSHRLWMKSIVSQDMYATAVSDGRKIIFGEHCPTSAAEGTYNYNNTGS